MENVRRATITIPIRINVKLRSFSVLDAWT